MNLLPLSHLSTRPDEVVGQALLGNWIVMHAELRGIRASKPTKVPADFAEAIGWATAAFEMDELKHMPVARALSLAANGKFERAGRLIREVMEREGEQAIQRQLAAIGARARAQRKDFSERGNASKKATVTQNHSKWLSIGKRLRDKHPHKSNAWLAKEIARESGHKESTIRAALPKLGLQRKES
jgi:hypothetical protein